MQIRLPIFNASFYSLYSSMNLKNRFYLEFFHDTIWNLKVAIHLHELHSIGLIKLIVYFGRYAVARYHISQTFHYSDKMCDSDKRAFF